jgi:hypothetical protein
MNIVCYWSLIMSQLTTLALGSLRLLLATAALCFVAAMPVSLDLVLQALA